MDIIQRRNGKIEYYPKKGLRFVKKDRTATYPWFISLKPGDSIENYEELPEDEVVQIETLINNRA